MKSKHSKKYKAIENARKLKDTGLLVKVIPSFNFWYVYARG